MEGKLTRRKCWVDICKALLIISVVIGHTWCPYKPYIFWFHMPLFFLINGYLLKLPKTNSLSEIKNWIFRRAKRYFIPCVIFWVIFQSLIYKSLSLLVLLKFIFGGRIQPGVYWFIQVLFLSQIAILLIEAKIKKKKMKIYAMFFCFCIAVLESWIIIPSNTNIYPIYLCPPWGVDICLMAIPFIAAGYYGKHIIDSLVKLIQSKCGWIYFVISLVIFSLFVIASEKGYIEFTLDMKYSHYANAVFDIVFPVTAFVVILYISICVERVGRLRNVISFVGSCSMIIMYIHIPVRDVLISQMGDHYSIFFYLLIVLGVALLLKTIYLMAILMLHGKEKQ